MKIEKIKETKSMEELIKYVSDEEGIYDTELISKPKMECVFNGSLWKCGNIHNKEIIDKIDHINILDKEKKCSLFIGKEPVSYHIDNTVSGGKNGYISFHTKKSKDKDYLCMIGHKYQSDTKIMNCGTIEDFKYFFAPAFKITLEESDKGEKLL